VDIWRGGALIMWWQPDGSVQLNEVEQVAADAFAEMSDWGHADALAWARVAVFEKYGDTAPAIDATLWEWLVHPSRVGPVVESPAQEVDGSVVWIADQEKE